MNELTKSTVGGIVALSHKSAGKLLFGRLTEKKLNGQWVRLSIGIYLHE